MISPFTALTELNDMPLRRDTMIQ